MKIHTYERAKAILHALVLGIDPETGKPLAEDAILSRADVMRSLLAGVDALGSVIGRETRRANLPGSVGKSWTGDEEQRLIAAFEAKTPIAEIAHSHGRTVRAIEARLEKVGLLQPDQRSTSNSFMTAKKKKSQ